MKQVAPCLRNVGLLPGLREGSQPLHGSIRGNTHEMCQELLVPLICGATNVTMNSAQLKEVMIPVPVTQVQDEVIEAGLLSTAAHDLMAAAIALRDASSDDDAGRVAEGVIEGAEKLRVMASSKTQVSAFIPATVSAGRGASD